MHSDRPSKTFGPGQARSIASLMVAFSGKEISRTLWIQTPPQVMPGVHWVRPYRSGTSCSKSLARLRVTVTMVSRGAFWDRASHQSRSQRSWPDKASMGNGFDDEADLVESVATLLADGKVVGWFQGRMGIRPGAWCSQHSWAIPRSAAAQATMNLKIKFRESFRPFRTSGVARTS